MNEKEKQLKQSGQTLIEFVLLIVVLVSLSFFMLRGFNSAIGERWRIIVQVISDDPATPVLNLR
ncbi:MAG: hypothetical protein OXB84_00710 [Halobacteriovoraceae bacterium]|nr:hypothetical protein [Halobacteriovoraceae bacterium]